MSFIKQGLELITCQNGQLKIWDTKNFELTKTIEMQNKDSFIEFLPDDDHLIAFSKSPAQTRIHFIRDYLLLDPDLKHCLVNRILASFSKASKYQAIASYDNNKLIVYEYNQSINMSQEVNSWQQSREYDDQHYKSMSKSKISFAKISMDAKDEQNSDGGFKKSAIVSYRSQNMDTRRSIT